MAAIMVAIIMNQGKKEALISTGFVDVNECVYSYNMQANAIPNACAGPCKPTSSSINSCLDACIGIPNAWKTSGWLYLFETGTCQYVYDNIPLTKCYMDCIYDGMPPFQCASSDGDNIYLGGTSTNAYITVSDIYMEESNKLWEFSCGIINGNTDIKIQLVDCPNGHTSNACIQPTTTYSQFLSYKSSYLTGDSFTSFIYYANQWVI